MTSPSQLRSCSCPPTASSGDRCEAVHGWAGIPRSDHMCGLGSSTGTPRRCARSCSASGTTTCSTTSRAGPTAPSRACSSREAGLTVAAAMLAYVPRKKRAPWSLCFVLFGWGGLARTRVDMLRSAGCSPTTYGTHKQGIVVCVFGHCCHGMLAIPQPGLGDPSNLKDIINMPATQPYDSSVHTARWSSTMLASCLHMVSMRTRGTSSYCKVASMIGVLLCFSRYHGR